jgi:4-hydroxybenzoate polyprenyltransferase
MRLAAIARLYSVPYTALAGLAAMLSSPTPLAVPAAVLCVLLPLTLACGLAALNDAIHAAGDRRADRGREYDTNLLLVLGLAGTASTLALAAVAGWWTLGGIAASIAGGLMYAKLKHLPGVGNLLRGVTSVPLVLGLGAIVSSEARMVAIACAVGLLDAAGNIWGDVRDRDQDRQSRTRTLALIAPRSAKFLAALLHLAAVLLLLPLTPWLALTLPGTLWCFRTAQHWSHRAFLMTKYLFVGVLAWSLQSSMLEQVLVTTLVLSAGWAWWVYTQIHPRPHKETTHHGASAD